MQKKQGRGTVCVHTGTKFDPLVGGVNTPIHPSSAFVAAADPGGSAFYRYPRYQNIPTQQAAAEKIAALESGEEAVVTASGLSAVVVALLGHLKHGDHVVFQADLYGGTHHFITTELARQGVDYTFVPETDPAAYAAAVTPRTTVLYAESPSNPLLKVYDLRGLAAVAKQHGLVSMIDNTFATPINQRPLELGFDVSIHSGTKYLNGHSDLNCGAVVASRELMGPILERAVNYGPTLNVLDCYLLERGMKTLAVRMARHNANAQAVAEFLAGHDKVRRVNYPGLADHPGHDIAKSQMDGFGGMMSFELDCDQAQAEAALARLRLMPEAVSLGGVESLVTFPAKTSHAKMTAAERAANGIGDTLVRMSVGIEDIDDLLADLDQALKF